MFNSAHIYHFTNLQILSRYRNTESSVVEAVARSSASFRTGGNKWGEGGREKKRKEGNREREKRRGVNTEILKRRKYNSSVLFAKYFLYFRSNRVPNRGHAIYMCSLPYIDEDFSVSFLAAFPLSLPPD